MLVVQNRCGFNESFVVTSIGLSAGLALFWRSDIKVSVQSSSLSHIETLGEGGRGDNIGHWDLTEFYGHSDTSLRAESWRLLTSLHGVSTLLWLVIGDFNKIMSASEEWGAQRPTS